MSDARIWTPVIGRTYIVRGYHTGDFFARCLSISRVCGTRCLLEVLDTMRPRQRSGCAFPDCVREDWHGGEHEFPRIRVGACLSIEFPHAWYVPAEEISSANLEPVSNMDAWTAPSIPCSIAGFQRSTKGRIPSARRARCENLPRAAGGSLSSSPIG